MRGSHPTPQTLQGIIISHVSRFQGGWVTLSLLNKIDPLSQSLDKDTKEGLKKVGQEGDSGGPNIKTVSFW